MLILVESDVCIIYVYIYNIIPRVTTKKFRQEDRVKKTISKREAY